MSDAERSPYLGHGGPFIFSSLLADSGTEAYLDFQGGKDCPVDWESCVHPRCEKHRQLQEQHFTECTRWSWRNLDGIERQDVLSLLYCLLTEFDATALCRNRVIWTVAMRERALAASAGDGQKYFQWQVATVEPLEGGIGFAVFVGQLVAFSKWENHGYRQGVRQQLCEVRRLIEDGDEWTVTRPGGRWCGTITNEGVPEAGSQADDTEKSTGGR